MANIYDIPDDEIDKLYGYLGDLAQHLQQKGQIAPFNVGDFMQKGISQGEWKDVNFGWPVTTVLEVLKEQ